MRNVIDSPTAPDPALLATHEATLMRKHPSQITRARRDRTHPAHPDHPDAVGIPPHIGARRSQILAWWRGQGIEPGQDRRPGRRRTTPVLPPGLTAAQWAAVQGLAASEPVPAVMLAKLADKRLVGRRGTLTAKARRLLEQYPTADPIPSPERESSKP